MDSIEKVKRRIESCNTSIVLADNICSSLKNRLNEAQSEKEYWEGELRLAENLLERIEEEINDCDGERKSKD